MKTKSTETKSKAKPETSANDIAEEEASLVGEWDVKAGYNMGEGPSGIGDDPSMTLRLNEDLTGSLVDGPESYDFTWRYIGTNPAKYDSSVYYKNYECELSPGVKPPEGNSMEEFTIDVEVDDDNAIYLKFGDWLYYCERE